MILFRKVFSLILLLVLTEKVSCDYYTSISGLEELLLAEELYVDSLEKHLNEVEILNKQFKSLLDEFEVEHSQITENSSKYFENPINAFKAIRRIVVDMPEIVVQASKTWNSKVFNESTALPADVFKLPTQNDLRGASLGFARLQRMYKLETADMAKGYLKGHKYSSEMSAYNCFVLGQILYEAGEYQYASEWLLEALHKVEDIENGIATEDNEEDPYDSGELDEDEDDDDDDDDAEESGDIDYDEEADDGLEDTDTTDDETEDIKEANQDNEFGIFPHISAIEILEYLPSALYNSGYRNLALAMNAKLLALNPENQYGLANWKLFSRSAKEESRRRSMDKPQVPDSKLQSLYNKVCNGEVQQTAREKRHLRCRYVTNNVPFYFVGPLKMEELNSEPFVAYYHQIIYDNEIKQIIGAVEGSIERSRVGENKHSRYDEVRVSKNSWLYFAEHPFLEKISKRLEDITGLTIKTGEPLQIANYGIAGHYGPHHDFFPNSDGGIKGNRILTALFYINDVPLGGATAFPVLRLAVPPIKGSLVVWYNYHKSVQPDYRTWHAGCPVLQGSKWICNEWFNILEQEFKRPCGLEPDHEISLPYKDWN